MGEFLFCVDLIKVVVCLRLVRFRCRKTAQIIGTQSRVPGIMIGKLYRTNVSFADVVFSRGKFQINIPLAGFNACGKLQVKFRRNSCAGIPLVCIGINSCPDIIPVFFQNDFCLLLHDRVGKTGILNFSANFQNTVLLHAFAQIGIPQHKTIPNVIPYEFENSFPIVSTVVYVLYIIFFSESVILIQFKNIRIDITQVRIIHFRHRIFRKICIVLFGKVQISGKLSAIIGGICLLPQPLQISFTVVKCSQVGIRTHVTVVVQSHTGSLAVRFQHIFSQFRFLNAGPFGKDIRCSYSYRNRVRNHI